mmetsp:Transcript_37701/g.80553  ORF Transcript_37701/g.80553 Transcript_37701/m.80553 type:complete len:246 (+) Transcript_37701:2272-3009(+)
MHPAAMCNRTACTSLHPNAANRDECFDTGTSKNDNPAAPNLPKSLASFLWLSLSPGSALADNKRGTALPKKYAEQGVITTTKERKKTLRRLSLSNLLRIDRQIADGVRATAFPHMQRSARWHQVVAMIASDTRSASLPSWRSYVGAVVRSLHTDAETNSGAAHVKYSPSPRRTQNHDMPTNAAREESRLSSRRRYGLTDAQSLERQGDDEEEGGAADEDFIEARNLFSNVKRGRFSSTISVATER